MTDWNQYYQEYPVNKEWIWLNNCGTTPISSRTIKRMQEYFQGYGQKGIFTETASFVSVHKKILRLLSELLNCQEHELALIHNTSEGLSLVASGLTYREGDMALVLENEYPSNVYPWLFQETAGLQVEFIAPGNSPQEFLQNFQEKLSNKTKIVSLSAVHWCSGMPLPLQEISDICDRRNIILVLDGAQGVGHVPMDLQQLKIDYMAFPAWKWLLGPLGLGVLYIREGKEEQLSPVIIGQNSVVDGESYLPYKQELRPGAQRFEYSTPNFNDWVYFESSLELLAEIGFVQSQKRIFALADTLARSLRSIGYEVWDSQAWNTQTGIITCQKPGMASETLVEILKKEGVIAALRLGKIRFAPHIYNSEQQFDKIINILANV